MLDSLKLRHKINGAIWVTFLIIAVIFTSIQLPFQKKRFEDALEKIIVIIETLVKRDEEGLGNAIFEIRHRDLQLRLKEMLEVKGILSISIFDSKGKLLLSDGTYPMTADMSIDSQEIVTKQHQIINQITLNGKSALLYFKKIQVMGLQIGFIQIHYSLIALEQEQRLSFLIFSGLLVSIFVVMLILLNFILTRTIISPLTDLKNAALLISQGRLEEKINITRKDELGDLSKSFVDMRDAIRRKIADLHVLNHFGEIIAVLHDQQEILETALDVMRKKINAELGSVWLKNKKQQLEFIKCFPESVEQSMFSEHCHLFEGILRELEEQRKIIYISDYYPGDDFMGNNDQDEKDVAIICIPMLDQDELIGVMNFSGWVGKIDFKPEDEEFALTVARLTVVTNKNINMVKEREKAEIAREAAEASSKLKSEFLANMSHELRTPMNAILGFSQIIARSHNLNAQDKEGLRIISRSGEHLLTLINDVLDMAKIESGRITLNHREFDLYLLIDDVMNICKTLSNKKELYLRYEKETDVPRFVISDETRLRQILLNLLNNAVKFTEEGGITVRVKRNNIANQPNDVVNIAFEVEDTGSGIKRGKIKEIFDPFVQGKAGKISGEGTGLGLTISRKIARLMKGDIVVESKFGHGSIFTVNIQLKKLEHTVVQPYQTTRKVSGLKPSQSDRNTQFKILIVDDVENNRQLLSQLLSPLGLETREAINGREAIDVWKEWYTQGHPPDLIWMDIRMPVIDGIQATREIKRLAREKGKDTVVLAISASTFDSDVESILSAGCDDFVSKPFKESEIFEKMNQYLGLEYVYEESINIDESFAEQENADIHEEVKVLPLEWRSAMADAIQRLDHDEMINLVKQVLHQSNRVADYFLKQINMYDYDKIAEILQNK